MLKRFDSMRAAIKMPTYRPHIMFSGIKSQSRNIA